MFLNDHHKMHNVHRLVFPCQDSNNQYEFVLNSDKCSIISRLLRLGSGHTGKPKRMQCLNKELVRSPAGEIQHDMRGQLNISLLFPLCRWMAQDKSTLYISKTDFCGHSRGKRNCPLSLPPTDAICLAGEVNLRHPVLLPYIPLAVQIEPTSNLP